MPPLEGVRVLLLDDSRTMLAVYRQILAAAGVHTVLEATNVADALETCRLNSALDVALVDYELEDMNGADFVKLMRTASDSPAPDMALVVVTAHAERSVLEEVMTAGADAFVVKPTPARELVARLKAAHEARRGRRKRVV
jgi:CheY-like chemotaxis protein